MFFKHFKSHLKHKKYRWTSKMSKTLIKHRKMSRNIKKRQERHLIVI
jgi:hypothetical protein